MAIAIQKLNNEIGFMVSGQMLEQIYQWEFTIDKKVFKEQLATGSYKGRFQVDGLLEIMKRAEREGKIMPYYGAGGSSGACVYQFQLTDTQCLIKVEHSLTGDVLELETPKQVYETPLNLNREPEIQFSILPFVMDEDLEKPWNGERNKQLICQIADREYQNLTTWKNWVDPQALTARYIYKFGQVSIGPTGFAVKVEDVETGDLIDVTDYDQW